MPQLSQPYEAYERPGLVVSYKVANATRIYKGALVAVNAAGFLVPMNHAVAGLRFVGVANDTVDNLAGAAGDKSVNVTKSGAFVLKASGFTPAAVDLGKEVYAASDWEGQVVTTGLTTPYKVGTLVALETTSTGAAGMRVRIDNHSL